MSSNVPLNQLVEAIGVDATLQLAQHFGGVRLFFPRPDNLRSTHPLVLAIGLELARKLCALYTAERMAIPRASALVRRKRDEAILADCASLSVRRIARKYSVTETTVYKILRRMKERAVDPAPSALASAVQRSAT